MNREAIDDLKEQIPLMGYLRTQDWRPARPLSRGRWMGLCPLHEDRKPSFLVDANQDLFYCYGCGRGGGCLRAWLTQLGHSLPAQCQTGLVAEAGYDAYVRRIVFPLEDNL